MILWQLVNTGKFHSPSRKDAYKTACGDRVPMTATGRDIDLVDSSDRCCDPKCVQARQSS